MAADLGAGAVAVVGEHLDEHGDAAGGVALVGDRLVADAFELAGAPLDGPLDGVHRHRRVAGLLEHRAQRRVRVGVAAALAGRHLDLAQELGEELAARLVLGALLVLDRGPLNGRTSVAPHSTSCRGTAGGAGGRRASSGWNAATSTGPWRQSTGWPSTRGEHLDVGADPLDDGRPDEHGVERMRPASRVDVEVGLEAVDLAAEGVAAHGDVDGAEAALVGAAVEDLGAEQDHPGAGAERRHAVGEPLGERVEQAGRLEQHRHRGGLAARQHQRVDVVELRRRADLSGGRRRGSQGVGVARERALQGEDADLGGHLGASHRTCHSAYQPRSASLVVELVDLQAGASPRRGRG